MAFASGWQFTDPDPTPELRDQREAASRGERKRVETEHRAAIARELDEIELRDARVRAAQRRRDAEASTAAIRARDVGREGWGRALIALRLFGREVVAVEVVAGDEEDGDTLDYERGSDTERADLAAWRDAHDEDAEPPPVILAGLHRASRRKRAEIVRIGTKNHTDPAFRADDTRTRQTREFGFAAGD
ncbi:hypothetical protein [Gordonia sp. HS-NH1]|uniref:hypothetical protein n=1 Tax=Gordonia sp. HS-NH1 TaxID=1435068 RepID=UPI0006E2F12B|nr:hypothetical protein [Gordonia sp. HS-NH1]